MSNSLHYIKTYVRPQHPCLFGVPASLAARALTRHAAAIAIRVLRAYHFAILLLLCLTRNLRIEAMIVTHLLRVQHVHEIHQTVCGRGFSCAIAGRVSVLKIKCKKG
jgi:hypothetical protein